jgi:7-keto-8-aminopelargonate synthetase-like enzyme
MAVKDMNIMTRLTVTVKRTAIKWLEDIAASASSESKQTIQAMNVLRIINCQRDRLNRQSDHLNRQSNQLNRQRLELIRQYNQINFQNDLIKAKDDLIKAKDDLIKRQDGIIQTPYNSHSVPTLQSAT